jgi:Domain of unknown function (DU1801)
MAKAAQKTLPTAIDPDAYVEAVEPAAKREDARAIMAMMRTVTSLEPAMWGPSIIGFGSYNYVYDSGHSGTSLRMGFSPRKAALVVYCIPGYDFLADELARLGKHSIGKSCLYIKKLADVDQAVLEGILRSAWGEMAKRYP